MLPENSVCSTTCGGCLGTINGQDPLEPKVFCVFEDSAWSEEMGLKNCYDDITKPLCEEVIASDPPFDAGEEKCAKNSPQWKEVLQDVKLMVAGRSLVRAWCAASHPI